MNLQDLIGTYRQRADDAVAPYHVSDEDLARFASEAEREACVRGNLIYDDLSPDLVTIAVLANTHTYDLDPLVTRIEAVNFVPTGTTRGRELDLTGMDDLRDYPDWQGRSCSRPMKAVHIDTPHSLRIWPTPSVAGTAHLAVYRLPLFDLEDASDEPEIPSVHHDGLVSWMLYRAYSSKDSEQEDPARARDALAEFTSRFGERPSADTLRRQRERKRITTRYGGL